MGMLAAGICEWCHAGQRQHVRQCRLGKSTDDSTGQGGHMEVRDRCHEDQEETLQGMLPGLEKMYGYAGMCERCHVSQRGHMAGWCTLGKACGVHKRCHMDWGRCAGGHGWGKEQGSV